MKIACLIFTFLLVLLTQAFSQQNDEAVDKLLKLSSLKMGNNSIETLPILYQKNTLVFLKVVINGKEYLFLFDTGSSVCLISKEIASHSSMKSLGTFSDELGNQSNAGIFLQTIHIGNSSFDSVLCMVSDTKTLSEIGCVEIDGVIGANLINLCNWQIDPAKELLSFSLSPFKAGENSDGANIEYTSNSLPLLRLNYKDVPFYCLLDFGYSGYLELNNDILKKSRIKKSDCLNGFGRYALTVNSTIEDRVCRLIIDTLKSTYYKFPDVPTVFSMSKPKLGSALLKRYVVTLNSLERTVLLSPLDNKDTSSIPFPVNFGLNDSNELIISFIWETEEIKKAGLKVGQKVISVNDQHFKQLTSIELCELKNHLSKKTKFTIVIDDGKKIKTFELSKISR